MVKMPTRLLNLINGLTDDISAAVGHAFSSVGPILIRNEAPFFPDYTDHGKTHVESILSTCELLLNDDAWSVFTREDAATLVLATLAHDLGMLINIEGFQYLVSSKDSIRPVDKNDEPWEKLWREFQLEVRRFDGSTLMELLGSPEPVPIYELDPVKLSERGIRIVGEFLRRHHHRLAHEIVLWGMPTGNGRINLLKGIPGHLIEIAGLIARSHGVAIRECIETLIERTSTFHREYRHIHPTYLMSLVRLADYLDLDISRAPSSVLSAKFLRSPISRREWWSHKAVVDCHSLDDDPECLNVTADTAALTNIETFLIIEEKIKGIQQEIDLCWAVLGEVYGRFPPLNRLALKIRRIQSNIRKPAVTCQLPFVPHRASLESSRADLLKLLIGPLYGDHPGIGIRELIQNAIDAVRELDFILKSSTSYSGSDVENLEGDVVVYFEKDSNGDFWVVVADRGIGMTWGDSV